MVCVRETDMKQAWCLATNGTEETAKDLTWFYGNRWGIESGLRDTKTRFSQFPSQPGCNQEYASGLQQ